MKPSPGQQVALDAAARVSARFNATADEQQEAALAALLAIETHQPERAPLAMWCELHARNAVFKLRDRERRHGMTARRGTRLVVEPYDSRHDGRCDDSDPEAIAMAAELQAAICGLRALGFTDDEIKAVLQ